MKKILYAIIAILIIAALLSGCTGTGNAGLTNTITVSLVSPKETPSVPISGPLTYTISVSSTSADLSKCELYTNQNGIFWIYGTQFLSGKSGKLSWTWGSALTQGTHLYNAKCYNVNGDWAWGLANQTYVVGSTTPPPQPPPPPPPTNLVPTVSLTSPYNGAIFTATNNVTLAETATDTAGFGNCAMWTDTSGTWQVDAVQACSGATTCTQALTKTNLANKAYKWNTRCCHAAGVCAYAPQNYTFTVNYAPPAAPGQLKVTADLSGAPIYVDTTATPKAYTSASFALTPKSDYTVKITSSGRPDYVKRNVMVNSNQVTEMNVKLSPAYSLAVNTYNTRDWSAAAEYPPGYSFRAVPNIQAQGDYLLVNGYDIAPPGGNFLTETIYYNPFITGLSSNKKYRLQADVQVTDAYPWMALGSVQSQTCNISIMSITTMSTPIASLGVKRLNEMHHYSGISGSCMPGNTGDICAPYQPAGIQTLTSGEFTGAANLKVRFVTDFVDCKFGNVKIYETSS